MWERDYVEWEIERERDSVKVGENPRKSSKTKEREKEDKGAGSYVFMFDIFLHLIWKMPINISITHCPHLLSGVNLFLTLTAPWLLT